MARGRADDRIGGADRNRHSEAIDRGVRVECCVGGRAPSSSGRVFEDVCFLISFRTHDGVLARDRDGGAKAATGACVPIEHGRRGGAPIGRLGGCKVKDVGLVGATVLMACVGGAHDRVAVRPGYCAAKAAFARVAEDGQDRSGVPPAWRRPLEDPRDTAVRAAGDHKVARRRHGGAEAVCGTVDELGLGSLVELVVDGVVTIDEELPIGADERVVPRLEGSGSAQVSGGPFNASGGQGRAGTGSWWRTRRERFSATRGRRSGDSPVQPLRQIRRHCWRQRWPRPIDSAARAAEAMRAARVRVP